MQQQTIEARVAAGAALLDRQIPGWADRINPMTLMMCSTRNCVLGQLYGDFDTGRKVLGIGQSAAEHGFYESPNELPLAVVLENLALGAAWRDAVAVRLQPRRTLRLVA